MPPVRERRNAKVAAGMKARKNRPLSQATLAGKRRDAMSSIQSDKLEPKQVHDFLTDHRMEGLPFVVKAVPVSKGCDGNLEGHELHDDEHDKRLNVFYNVHPLSVWQSWKGYKNFFIGDKDKGTDVLIKTGDYIIVNADESPEDSAADMDAQWKAQVLEIRALDSEHVYIRVAWLYRPQDLSGAESTQRHGTRELFPTNHMDIIDAMAVNGTLSVEQATDIDAAVAGESYYWHRTLDVINGKKPSMLE